MRSKPIKRFSQRHIQCVITEVERPDGRFTRKSYMVEIAVTEEDGWDVRTEFYPWELSIVIRLLEKAEQWLAIKKVPPM